MGQAESGPEPTTECISQAAHGLWSVLRSTSRDAEDITVFEHVSDGSSAAVEAAIDNELQMLRRLRHPSIVLFQWCQDEEKTTAIVTEPVVLLANELAAMPAAEVCLGLHDLLLALRFLCDQGELSHNNVCVGSLFLSCGAHTWRLGGFACCRPLDECTAASMQSLGDFRDDSAICPEDGTDGAAQAGARDLYAFANLLQDLEEQAPSLGPDKQFASFKSHCRKTLQVDDPEGFAKVLDHRYFRANPLVVVVTFLRDLTIQTEDAKSAFFRTLPAKLRRVPESTAAKTVYRLLLNPILFTETGFLELLPLVLSPRAEGVAKASGFVSPELFREHVVPKICGSLLRSKDLQVRLSLLRHVQCYAPAMGKELLETTVVPAFMEGLSELDKDVFAETLSALGFLATLCTVSLTTAQRGPIFSPASEKCRDRRQSFSNGTSPPRRLQRARSPKPVTPPLHPRRRSSTPDAPADALQASPTLSEPAAPSYGLDPAQTEPEAEAEGWGEMGSASDWSDFGDDPGSGDAPAAADAVRRSPATTPDPAIQGGGTPTGGSPPGKKASPPPAAAVKARPSTTSATDTRGKPRAKENKRGGLNLAGRLQAKKRQEEAEAAEQQARQKAEAWAKLEQARMAEERQRRERAEREAAAEPDFFAQMAPTRGSSQPASPEQAQPPPLAAPASTAPAPASPTTTASPAATAAPPRPSAAETLSDAEDGWGAWGDDDGDLGLSD